MTAWKPASIMTSWFLPDTAGEPDDSLMAGESNSCASRFPSLRPSRMSKDVRVLFSLVVDRDVAEIGLQLARHRELAIADADRTQRADSFWARRLLLVKDAD